METQEKPKEKPLFDKDYINEINWDFWFFKSITIMGIIIFVALLGYFLWFMK